MKDTDAPGQDAQRREKQLLRKADHLSGFGTLTSLVSTAAYFVEQTYMKTKISAGAAKATLGAVAVGIATTIASYYYRYKAGKVALLNDKAAAGNARQLPQGIHDTHVPAAALQENWVERQQAAKDKTPALKIQ